MKLVTIIFLTLVSMMITGCSADSTLTITDTDLSNNEEILFDAIAKETYLFDLEGSLPVGKEMYIGVDYYEFGELIEEKSIFGVGRSHDEDEEFVEEYEKLFISLTEDESTSVVTLDIVVHSENGSYSTYSELGELNVEGKAFSSGSLLKDENNEIKLSEETIDEKNYLASFTISQDGTFRGFDLEHATQPNQDYEFMYLFYVQLQDYEEN
ncbi:hypothetical protein [Alkalicoccobacillus plakortidis]|uniref:Lipoprotein n=1 Tax=Alkalicoccobacillus plakortidis TaxID=444060 RepID=A0ABT0XPX8_9BACI|nr:hypothetical protein [Alkalicoccobacillus plakortidis]MCM2677745.1 hypothetical protein [Alkalicoccobacillus plakortidis]